MRKADPAHLRVPLMTLVDFRGCRLSAQSVVPLGGLIYGSADAAKTIVTDEDKATSPAVLASIRKLGTALNLAEHGVIEFTTGKIKKLCLPVRAKFILFLISSEESLSLSLSLSLSGRH